MVIPLRKLLVPIDFSPDAMAALEWATHLARRFGASLRLLHACRVRLPPALEAPPLLEDSIGERLREQAQRRLGELGGALQGQGVDADWETSPLLPSEAIAQACAAYAPDLVVMGTRGNTGLKHVLLGSVAERTLRLARCAVLAVKAADGEPGRGPGAPGSHPPSVARIVVPLDFSPDAQAALEVAIGLGRAFGSELHLVHAFQSPAVLVGLSEVAVPTQAFEEAYRAARERLEEACAGATQAGLTAHPHLTEGPAADAIVRVCQQVQASLIAMGSHGRAGIQRLLLGSVAERTLRLAPCPVLAVKAERD